MNYNDWMEELRAEDQAHRDYRDMARKFEKRYSLEKGEASDYNIFWANTEIMHAALYSQTPKADVQRRFRDRNPIAREVAAVLERAISFSLDCYDFDGAINPSINNFLVAGLGQVRVNYVPYLTQRATRVPVDTLIDPETGEKSYLRDGEAVEAAEDELGAFVEDVSDEIAYQAVDCSNVPWARFHWSPAKDWGTVWWVGECHYLTEDQMRQTFVIGGDETVPLGFSRDGKSDGSQNDGDLARVIEVWDKRTRTHFGIVEGMARLLKFRAGDETAEDDPLGLSGFWPYPKPMAANVIAGKFCPIPDFAYYETQADEMDRLTRRIEGLTDQLRYRGVYDGTFQDLANLTSANDGDFKAIENFAARFGDGRGLQSIMATLPLEELRGVIAWLIQAREEVKATIFEITGISDIVRGATKATETLGAQQLKSQFGSMRMTKRQKAVEHFIRDIFRIKAEIIAEHFEPEVLSMMTGIEVTPEMVQIMRSDVLREFGVDVETDSTIISDQGEEQQRRTEVVTAITQLVTAWAPMIAQAPMLAGLAKDLISFQLGAFKHGRTLEDAIEQAFAQVGDVAASPAVGVAGGADRVANPAPGNNVVPLSGP